MLLVAPRWIAPSKNFGVAPASRFVRVDSPEPLSLYTVVSDVPTGPASQSVVIRADVKDHAAMSAGVGSCAIVVGPPFC
jgi:hypothetical protein